MVTNGHEQYSNGHEQYSNGHNGHQHGNQWSQMVANDYHNGHCPGP